MRSRLLFVVFLLFIQGSLQAQEARVRRFTAPLAGAVVLSNVDDKYSADVISMEMPEPGGEAEQQELKALKEKVSVLYPRKMSAGKKKTTSAALPPVVAISFPSDSLTGIPPDNYMAISKGNKIVGVVNSWLAVQDAATGAFIVPHKNLKVFSLPVGLTGAFDSRFDPKVIYDPEADRFICVMLNGTDQHSNIVLAFSQSNDPAGGWNFYKFYSADTTNKTWFDYPAISITKNEFFLTGNLLTYDSSWQKGFQQTLIYQVRKQDGYNAAPSLTYRIWDSIKYNNKIVRFFHPVCPADVIPGPAQYFVSDKNFDLSNDSIFIARVPDTIGAADSILTVTPVTSSTASYGVPPNGRQPDTSVVLQTNDGRILGGFMKDDEIQFVSTSVNPANGSSAIYHGIIDNVNTTPTMKAQLISVDTLDFGYPNISYTGHVNYSVQSIISFEFTGPHTYPGYGAVQYNGADYSDMVIIKQGDSSISLPITDPKYQRWGDYSGSQPDWNMLGAVWVEGLYGRKTHVYGSYIAKLVSQYHEAVPVVAPNNVPSKLYPNPSVSFVQFDFDVQQEQVFSFLIYDVQGKLVDKILDKNCHDGKNIIQFNIATLQPGTYFLKAIGEKGENIAVHTFVRQ